MSTSVIRVQGLGKKYRIQHQLALQARYASLRDLLGERLRGLFSRRATAATPAIEDFWALKDVSFEVARGEVLGIIGRNGAGKSTLLKVLSQITEPTCGRVELDGRVASLLEVGAGFHPELSGRENIRLNGAILGMSRHEIARKFDEIVAFAEVEKFLDTPVKRYSSGMYMRLAFSVAAHLEPEILVVDEVLAVGDTEFQRKCLGKMKSVASSDGRTVLFVSHNMAAVETLCTRAMLLNKGGVEGVGPVAELVERYARARTDASEPNALRVHALSPGVSLEELAFSPNPVRSGEPIEFTLRLSSREATKAAELSILLYSEQGARAAILDLRSTRLDTRFGAGTPLVLKGRVAALPLVEGEYSVGLYLNCADVHSNFLDLNTLTVARAEIDTDFPPYRPQDRGVVELVYEFDRA